VPRPPGVGVGSELYLKMTDELTLGMNKIFVKLLTSDALKMEPNLAMVYYCACLV